MIAALVRLGARRTVHATVLVALALAAWAAASGGSTEELLALGGVRDDAARAGAWTEACWTAFLVLVAPCLVLRAAGARTRGEVAWVAVSRSGVARGEASRALGVVLASAAILAAWCAFVALGPRADGDVLARAGTASGPSAPLFDAAHPLVWRAAIPSEPGLRARVEVSLSITAGGGGEVRLSARRTGAAAGVAAEEGRALVLPRGGVDVAVPEGAGDVELALSLPEPGARGWIASDAVTTWRGAPAWTVRARVAARAALALLAALLLAFGLGAWIAPGLALGLVASAAIAVAFGAEAAWIPGAALAHDLGTVAEGRAPAPLAATEIAAAVGCALAGLALAARRPEGRP